MTTTIKKTTVKNVDEYIRSFPANAQAMLNKIRHTIKKAAPEAEEMISYGIAGYKYNGMLIYFAGFANHVSVYPAPRTSELFKKELAGYKGGKGTVQFPLDKPLPLDLIKRIVTFRLKAKEGKIAMKKAAPSIDKQIKQKISPDEQVNNWMNMQDKKTKTAINSVRKIIKSASSKLTERIKWNAPSYYIKPVEQTNSNGVDILTFGPYRDNKILLVIHHPAVVKVKSALLQGNYHHRRLVYFNSKAEAEKNKKELTRIINEIITIIEKK